MTELEGEGGGLSEHSQSGTLPVVVSDGVTEESSERIAVRATVHLPGLPLGARALVDPSDPQIERYLEGKFLVRVESGDETGN